MTFTSEKIFFNEEEQYLAALPAEISISLAEVAANFCATALYDRQDGFRFASDLPFDIYKGNMATLSEEINSLHDVIAKLWVACEVEPSLLSA